MNVNGTEGLSEEQIEEELRQGARFVTYLYCISIGIMTFKRSSDLYFLRPGEHGVVKGLGYTIVSLLLGWWGIPWGPIYTIQSLWVNLGGGRDVTEDILIAATERARQAAIAAETE